MGGVPKVGGHWKGPTIREIAELSGLGTATVDRVLNGRPGVRDKTREKVQAALRKLSQSAMADELLRIGLLC
ncbi:HTH-type transcriptional regulator TreR [Defluviimonas aquaemixtae]|uniref:HTH-type transcriptional regulator TreR n=1 Tax=Albidovulum aquaemixtae TaxID=1542388 RepID=A0A2R8BMR3_9RHOB|nr:LacI family DNA-binding transcriptional regulator [Defluviimonas aquaemixtae]SPH24716.1 HTH-type transcriptional regulator TreR [Defluviimonas aquaemixtae]